MANVQSGKMIVGLDIGTSKVVALVGEVSDDGTLEIVGIGTHPSRGLKKGVVVNIESTVQSIQRDRRSPTDGGLPHSLGVRRRGGQSHPQPELPRHRRDP